MKAFVFTDIVNSTGLKQDMSGFGFGEKNRNFVDQILRPHRDRLENGLAAHGGALVNLIGDGCFLAFRHPFRAAMWAISVQESHQNEPIEGPDGQPVGMKIAIHWGDASRDPNDASNFIGRSVDYAARLVDFGRTGQVLLSETVYAMLKEAGLTQADYGLYAHGERDLRGIGSAPIYELLWNGKEHQPLKGDPEIADKPQSSLATPESDTVAQPIEGSMVGEIQLIRKIGQGGMGSVFLGLDTTMDRECVIKVINDRFLAPGHEELVERFYNEIKMVAGLKHSNIVQAYYASSRTAPIPYLVLEHIRGIGVERLIADKAIVSIADACEIAAQTARALTYIHRKGLVHRDIKPSNIMLTHDEDGHAIVKVLDLGLALLVNDADEHRITTVRERAMGTAYYMPPEQWSSTDVDIRADIYALGCTLYHMLAGYAPFEFSEYTQKKAHRNEVPAKPPGAEHFPPGLWEVIKKMLAKKSADRFADPNELLAALGKFRQGSNLESLLSTADLESSIGTINTTPTKSTLAHRSTTPKPMPVLSRRTLLTLGGVAATTAVAGGVIWKVFATGEGNDPSRFVVDDETLGEIATHTLLTDPGPIGQWWFEDAPWYAPPMRLTLLQSLTVEEYSSLTASLKSGQATEFYRNLQTATHDAIADNSDQLRWYRTLATAANWETATSEQRTQTKEKWDAFVRSLTNSEPLESLLQKPETLSASHWHLLALALTRVATLTPRQFEPAMRAFASAEAAYVAEAKTSGNPAASQALRGLCQADWGEACSIFGVSHRDDAILYFEQAIKTLSGSNGNASPGSERQIVWTSSRLGITQILESQTYSRAKQRATLEAAEPLLSKLNSNDPVAIFLQESFARYALENEDFAEAASKSLTAADARKQQAFSQVGSDSKVANPDALSFYLRDMQLYALAEHYNGKSATAARKVEELFTNYFKTIAESDSLTPDQKNALESQRPNQQGRWADMLFFGTADFANAQKKMAAAIEEATPRFATNLPQHLAYMRFKMTLFLSLGGEAEGKSSVAGYYDPAVTAYRSWREGATSDDAVIAGRSAGYLARNRLFCMAATATHQPELLPELFDEFKTAPEDRLTALKQVVTITSEDDPNSAVDRDDRQLLLFLAYYLDEAATETDSGIKRLVQQLENDRRGQPVFDATYLLHLRAAAASAASRTK